MGWSLPLSCGRTDAGYSYFKPLWAAHQEPWDSASPSAPPWLPQHLRAHVCELLHSSFSPCISPANCRTYQRRSFLKAPGRLAGSRLYPPQKSSWAIESFSFQKTRWQKIPDCAHNMIWIYILIISFFYGNFNNISDQYISCSARYGTTGSWIELQSLHLVRCSPFVSTPA